MTLGSFVGGYLCEKPDASIIRVHLHEDWSSTSQPPHSKNRVSPEVQAVTTLNFKLIDTTLNLTMYTEIPVYTHHNLHILYLLHYSLWYSINLCAACYMLTRFGAHPTHYLLNANLSLSFLSAHFYSQNSRDTHLA